MEAALKWALWAGVVGAAGAAVMLVAVMAIARLRGSKEADLGTGSKPSRTQR
jgi:hypothetical protein